MKLAAKDVDEVRPRVREIIADALGRDVEETLPEKTLIEDLGAESIDFLDIVYRLERAFRVRIPRGDIEVQARGGLEPEAFERDGVLTERGLASVRAYLDEIPPERFRPGMATADLPLLFTVETFCRIVARARRAAAAG